MIITVNLLGKAFSCIHTCAHTPFFEDCVYVGVVSVCGPPHMNRAGPCALDSCLLWTPKNKKKGLKSSDLPLSCVHLIPLFLTLLSLHSALWPEAAACYLTEFNLWSRALIHSLWVFSRRGKKKAFNKNKVQLRYEMSSCVASSQCVSAADVKACWFGTL